MTCASHVQANGKGFPGQLGRFDDIHIEGHKRLVSGIHQADSLAIIQLHHAGIRSPKVLVDGGPVGPSIHVKSNARALTLTEVHELRDAFIDAAMRAQQCGYDGVEIHGAHGYILCQFLSAKYNRRQDEYGGSLDNRSRLLFEIVAGIRSVCGPDFLLGIRLSPERFGMVLQEIKTVCRRLINTSRIDFLDISLWDYTKMPEEESHRDKTLIQHFADIDFKKVKWTVAGKIYSASDVRAVMNAGVDFVTIGRAAILHHDFPEKIRSQPDFKPVELPVSSAYLQEEGLGERFIEYMGRWPGFIEN
jgi:2,4-dienoyl-CoA reductase-like NADH-dependent reductase (Old Yellow Enzyme family)